MSELNVNLTPQLEALVQRQVESGLYNNQSEVVRRSPPAPCALNTTA